MPEKETDQQEQQTPEEEPEGETAEPESEESEESAVTPEQAMELAQALQKGYTVTRQEMAEIRQNQEVIQSALDELSKKKGEEYGENLGDEEPLTVKKLLEIQNQQEAATKKEDVKIDKLIDSQLNDLRVQGTIKTKEDEDKLLNFAVDHKITELSVAANLMAEIKNAKGEEKKVAAKSKVKQEAGSQIGTSKKTETIEQGEIPYEKIAGKSMEDIIEESEE